MNGSNEAIRVEFEWKKAKQHCFFLLSNCPKVLKIFYDLPVKYYVGDFIIWLLDNGI